MDDSKKLDKLLKEISSLRKEVKLVRKGNRKLGLKMNAILRSQYLDLSENVTSRRFQIFSQNEEDGIILTLLKESKAKSHAFIELGSGGTGGNSGLLAHEMQWRGLMVDAVPERIEECKKKFFHNRNVRYTVTMITPENVNDIIKENDVADASILSLDIDSYDYYVFEAIECRPEVVVLEYNSWFEKESVTVPLNEIPDDAPKGYHGASLKALTRLAEKKGYRLVCCDNSGINAFYLRNDVAEHIPGISPDEAYRPQTNRIEFDLNNTQPDHRFNLDFYKSKGLPFVEV